MASAGFLICAFSSCSFQELSAFPREVGGSGAGLHPVVYPCTALLLLCLFSTIITYILNHSSIRVSRKGWHMLLNLCFHMAMTSAVFAGGITLTNYQTVCQAVSRRKDQGGGLQDQWWQHRVGRCSGGKGLVHIGRGEHESRGS